MKKKLLGVVLCVAMMATAIAGCTTGGETPTSEVVFCNNDAMVLGAAQAIAAGRTVGEDIYLVGVDALTEALEKVVTGEMTGTVFNDHIGQASKAVEVTALRLSGETTDVYYRVDYVKATQDNAQEILGFLQ